MLNNMIKLGREQKTNNTQIKPKTFNCIAFRPTITQLFYTSNLTAIDFSEKILKNIKSERLLENCRLEISSLLFTLKAI